MMMKRNLFARHGDRETLERLKRWPQLKARFPFVRIYSAQWDAFWRGTGQGYTENALESEIFTIDAALRMTQHCGPEKQIQYVEANDNHEAEERS